MLTKRNLAMMMTMIVVILLLFLSSPVLKEYFNDYDVNHAAEHGPIGRIVQDLDANRQSNEQPILYVGTENKEYCQPMREWAAYRKKTFWTAASLEEAIGKLQTDCRQKPILLLDGSLLAANTREHAERLSRYVEQGGVVIFYRLPDYQVIQGCDVLQNLLGIQQLRAESVRLHEIRIYSGFLLGGETCYSFEGVQEPELVDLEREIPWYDISARTKTYMAGFLSAAEKEALALRNEDMPAILWRSNLGSGSVFAVNGAYMQGETCLGMLDAMLYEAAGYALYPVVNAQNLSVAGFPDLTVENEQKLAETYGMTSVQFCRDVLWPSLVAGVQKGGWKLTCFVSMKQQDQSGNEPNRTELINYLKYFNEESAEAGASLGRMGNSDLRMALADEREIWRSWQLEYALTGGYVRKEHRDDLLAYVSDTGQIEFFEDLRTVVGEYELDAPILSWLSDQMTLQNVTANAYVHSYQDSLRLKSLETALGYSNVQIDIYRVLWPEKQNDTWEKLAEKMAAHIDTYWKPFAAFDKTTISESDSRVRNFLNGRVESSRVGNQIFIQTEAYTGDAYLLLRTHGEELGHMTGGTWKQVEQDSYLLQLTAEKASVTLQPPTERYYKE